MEYPAWSCDELLRCGVVDGSPAMLACCRKKADVRGLNNIVFQPGGFFTYDRAAAPVDFVVSSPVLHFLPDSWKLASLRRAAQTRKPGGRLDLSDIVFPAAETDLPPEIDAWIGAIGDRAGPEFAAEAETRVREEYSTCDWIMEGPLARAGLRIDCAKYGNGFGAGHVCTRE
jgi:putative AdoMet-dependent methyltransferase